MFKSNLVELHAGTVPAVAPPECSVRGAAAAGHDGESAPAPSVSPAYIINR